MRTVPPAIANALASSGAQPSISVTSLDVMTRTAPAAVAARPAGRSAALVTTAGTILLATIPPGPGAQSVSLVRITNPTITAQWQVASPPVITSTALGLAGVALVQTGATIRLFHVNSTTNYLVYRDSTNDGQTFGAEQVCASGPASSGYTCTGIAADSTSSVYSAWYLYPQAASFLYRSTYSTSWSPMASVGPPAPVWGAIRGITVASNGAGLLCLVAGVQLRAQQSGIAAASATFNGTTWSAFSVIQPMDTPTNGLGYQNPAVSFDSTNSTFYSTIQLQDNGSVSGTMQNRALTYQSTDGLNWALLLVSGNIFQNEVHYLPYGSPTVTYQFDAASVLASLIPPNSADLSNDVLSLHVVEEEGKSTAFTLRLANNQGQYTTNATIRDNAQVSISLGYNGTTIPTHTVIIDSVEYRAGPEIADLLIHGRDLRKNLDQIVTKFTPLANQTVAQIATAICTSANVPLAPLPTTAQFAQPIPSFLLTPGETWLAALTRLADVYQFDILCATPPAVKLVERSASDSSSWSYGPEHLGVVWQQSADQPNVVRVVGASTSSTNIFAEAVDTANVQVSGVHRYQHVIERMATTSAQCLLKAQPILRDDQTQQQTGALTVTINPQLEIGDVITISEPRVGLNNQRARINRIDTQIEWTHGQWSQRLTLELP